MSTSEQNKELILPDASCKAILNRIAYEIYESNYGSKRLVLVGIEGRGAKIAKQIKAKLEEISSIEIVSLIALKLEEEKDVRLKSDAPKKDISRKNVIIIDDVLYSGKTMFKAIAEIEQYNPNRIQNAVLIDRGHRSIPVRPDFVGVELATTLKQHVTVEVGPRKKIQAFLI